MTSEPGDQATPETSNNGPQGASPTQTDQQLATGKAPPTRDEAASAAPVEQVSLDAYVEQVPWPDHGEALGRWRQGHIVRNVPLAWISPASPESDPMTGLTSLPLAEEPDGAEDIDISEDSRDGGEAVDVERFSGESGEGPAVEDASLQWLAGVFDVIVVSQTCDLGGGPPGDKHPFFLVAPLITRGALGSPQRQNLAAQGRLDYIFATRPPDPRGLEAAEAAYVQAQHKRAAREAERARADASKQGLPTPDEEAPDSKPPRAVDDLAPDSRWYADLRLMVPVSKTLLLRREPVTAFYAEEEYLRFSEVIAQKFRRPALHEALSEDLSKLLTKFANDTGVKKSHIAGVEQVRLHMVGGSRLYPNRVQLFVITNAAPLSEDDKKTWEQFDSKAEALLRGEGFEYISLLHQEVGRMSAAVYRETVPLKCAALGHTRWT